MRIDSAVRQSDMNPQVRVLAIRLGKPALVGENVCLARLKRHVDRVLADDGCDWPGRRLNKISYGEFRDADFPVDWRTNLCVAKIDLGLLEQCLRLQDVGLGA